MPDGRRHSVTLFLVDDLHQIIQLLSAARVWLIHWVVVRIGLRLEFFLQLRLVKVLPHSFVTVD